MPITNSESIGKSVFTEPCSPEVSEASGGQRLKHGREDQLSEAPAPKEFCARLSQRISLICLGGMCFLGRSSFRRFGCDNLASLGYFLQVIPSLQRASLLEAVRPSVFSVLVINGSPRWKCRDSTNSDKRRIPRSFLPPFRTADRLILPTAASASAIAS